MAQTTATVLTCDQCRTAAMEMFFVSGPLNIERVKPNPQGELTPQATHVVYPGHYCLKCLTTTLQGELTPLPNTLRVAKAQPQKEPTPRKVFTTEPTPAGTTPNAKKENTTRREGHLGRKCSTCPNNALYEMVAQDSDILGYACEGCKTHKPDPTCMYR